VSKYWELSDQKHWFIKCPHCNKEQYLKWPESIDPVREVFVCRHCAGELSDNDRRRGRWVAKFKNREFSGYWIPLLIAPWMSAKKILKYYTDNTEEYFYNRVLGLPYVGSGNKVQKDDILGNLTKELNTQEGRIVIGVDTGIYLRYVVGNSSGIFYYGQTKKYEDIEILLRRYANSIAVFDAGGDIVGVREMREKYPGRVYLCHYGVDRKTLQLVRWGDNDESGNVIVDRNRMIQLVIDEFKDRRIPLQGNENEWWDFWLHWDHIYRVQEEDNLGVLKSKWLRNGRDDWCFVAETEIITDKGIKQIKDVNVGDKVLTRNGYETVYKSGISNNNAKVIKVLFSNGRELIATPNHKIWIKNKGFIRLDATVYGDIVEVANTNKTLCQQKQSSLMELSLEDTQKVKTEHITPIIPQVVITERKVSDIFIKRFGDFIMVKYQKIVSYIIKIIIRLITILLTWCVLQIKNTGVNIKKKDLRIKKVESKTESILIKSDHYLTSGEKQKLARNGIQTTLKKHLYCLSQKSLFVLNVIKKVLLQVGKVVSFVQKDVLIIGTQEIIERKCVYNLSVSNNHEYYANGILVSNCHATAYWRTGMSRFGNIEGGEIFSSLDERADIAPEVQPDGTILNVNPLNRQTTNLRDWKL
jgi:hypothetical protein